MKPSVVYLRPRAVAFVRARGPYKRSVGEAWMEMFGWLEKQGIRDDVSVGYGLAYDNPRLTGADNCRYDACVELPRDSLVALAGEIRTQYLPGGAYVRSRVAGSYLKIAQTLATMRDDWMPKAGLALDLRRPVIAVYLSDPRHVAEDQRKADICLPVNPDHER